MANRMRNDDYERHPNINDLCGYQYLPTSNPPECCGCLKENGSNHCIFHSDKKDLKKFNNELQKPQPNQRGEYDFEGYVFPPNFNFSAIFGSRSPDPLYKNTITDNINFCNATFNSFLDPSSIIFEGSVIFGNATFNADVDFSGSSFENAIFNNIHMNDKDNNQVICFIQTDMQNCQFRNADLRKAYFQKASLKSCDLEGIQYTELTKKKIYLDTYTSNTNRIFAREAADYNYLEELKEKNHNKIWFKIWKWTSNYGRSIPRWTFWCLGLILLFAFLFCVISKPSMSFWRALFSSITLFTTLGFGDIPDKAIGVIRLLAIIEVIFGYIMLGVLISIFTEKIARRS